MGLFGKRNEVVPSDVQACKAKLDDVTKLFDKIMPAANAGQTPQANQALFEAERAISEARNQLVGLNIPRTTKGELFEALEGAAKLRFVAASYLKAEQLFETEQTLSEAGQIINNLKKRLVSLTAVEPAKTPQPVPKPAQVPAPVQAASAAQPAQPKPKPAAPMVPQDTLPKKLAKATKRFSSGVEKSIDILTSRVKGSEAPKPMPQPKSAHHQPNPAQHAPAGQYAQPRQQVKPSAPPQPGQGAAQNTPGAPPIKVEGREYVHTTAGDLNLDKLKKKVTVKFGVPGFDDLFMKKLPRDTSMLVTGSPGAGKTLFCLQALYNKAKEGHKCLYISFGESVPRLISYMYDFGMDYHSVADNFQIQRVQTFALARDIEALLAKTTKELKVSMDRLPVLRLGKENFKPEFVVVDSITALFAGFAKEQINFRLYLEELLRHFEREKVFVFIISEKGLSPSLTGVTGLSAPTLKFEHYMTDSWINFLNINIKGARQRGIEVIKTRGCDHVKKTVPLEITGKKGVVIYPEEVIFYSAPEKD